MHTAKGEEEQALSISTEFVWGATDNAAKHQKDS